MEIGSSNVCNYEKTCKYVLLDIGDKSHLEYCSNNFKDCPFYMMQKAKNDTDKEISDLIKNILEKESSQNFFH